MSIDPVRRARSQMRRRNLVLRTRVDAREYAAILASATTVGCAVATYLRESALKRRRHAKCPNHERALVAEIGRIITGAERLRGAPSTHWPHGLDAIMALLRALAQRVISGDSP